MTTPGHRFAAVVARATTLSLIAVVMLLLALFLLGSSPNAQEAPRRVLMLHAFNYTFPATTAIGDAARKRLIERSRKKIEIDADFLDLGRITDPDHELRMADFL